MKFQGSKHVKLKYKSDFHEARKTFDGLNRRKKRKYITEEQRKLEKLLDSQNKTHFWKSIGKVGIVNDRKPNIPWAITDENGNIKTDRDSVLNKWRDDLQTFFTSDSTNTEPFNEKNFYDNLNVTSLSEEMTRDEVKLAVAHAVKTKKRQEPTMYQLKF